MSEEIKILDHGSVRLVESWGSDERVIEAARMSTGKGFQGWGPGHTGECRQQQMHPNIEYDVCDCPKNVPGDEKLLKFLWDHRHHTPFEMAGLAIEVQAPIFVFREWHRHRTASINEMSARYAPLPDVNYVPTVERLMINAGGSNKQAGTVAGSETLTEEKAREFQNSIDAIYQLAEITYRKALADGVPKELARVHLPLGRYSRMRWSANLRNVLHFLTLRCDPAAQWEIRQYAEAVASIVAQLFPRTHALWSEK